MLKPTLHSTLGRWYGSSQNGRGFGQTQKEKNAAHEMIHIGITMTTVGRLIDGRKENGKPDTRTQRPSANLLTFWLSTKYSLKQPSLA